MKYAHYDKDTQELLGWYDKEIHDEIPEPNIEVSEEDWKEAINENANYVDVDNKKVIFKDLRTEEQKFNDLKNYLFNLNNSVFDKRAEELTSQYPEREILTWDEQEKEARAFLADEDASTPLLDNLAETRDVDKEDLAKKIVEKADNYAKKMGILLGKRQKIRDLIESKTELEDLEDIDVVKLWDE